MVWFPEIQSDVSLEQQTWFPSLLWSKGHSPFSLWSSAAFSPTPLPGWLYEHPVLLPAPAPTYSQPCLRFWSWVLSRRECGQHPTWKHKPPVSHFAWTVSKPTDTYGHTQVDISYFHRECSPSPDPEPCARVRHWTNWTQCLASQKLCPGGGTSCRSQTIRKIKPMEGRYTSHMKRDAC